MHGLAGRSIPSWLAPVVQDFELQGSTLVTATAIQHARPELTRPMARLALAHLVKRGWLQPTGARGVYEFIPGAAAGPYPSGDPWIPLRAVLFQAPEAFHIGANSAAWLLGYAQRSPDRHIVVTTPEQRIPRVLRSAYHVVEMRSAIAHGSFAGLPVPTPSELFIEVAYLAPRLDLDAAQGWLRRMLDDVPVETVLPLLRAQGSATQARAGYFAEICGATLLAESIAAIRTDNGTGPFYTGSRTVQGPYAARWRVYDTGHVGGV